MHLKANCNHGAIVDKDGNIIQAWSWYSTPECPHEFDVPDGAEVVTLTPDEHEKVHRKLHTHKLDRKKGCVVCKETGKEIKIKSKQKEK